jgi:glycosyltransferase involved in cell wall biosynthesis
VLTNSDFTVSLVRRYYGREALVCRLGVDSAGLIPAEALGSYILSVGALETHKGFDFLVRSIARLSASTRPDLAIVANYANPGVRLDLERLAKRLGVRLHLKIGVSEAELVRLYQGAALLAYAPHEEPFGLAVLEAMACGLPVVAVGEGGVRETVRHGENGLLTPRDEEQFSAALKSLLANQELALTLGGEGRRIATSEWAWDAAARRLESHLRQAAMTAGTAPAAISADRAPETG